jgi:hypothetical protein
MSLASVTLLQANRPGGAHETAQVDRAHRRRGRHARLHDAQMVDDESRVGMAIDQRSARV